MKEAPVTLADIRKIRREIHTLVAQITGQIERKPFKQVLGIPPKRPA